MYRLSPVVTLVFFTVSSVTAFAPQSSIVSGRRTNTVSPLQESFGFDFAEDSYGNTPAPILGEARYKQWVGEITDNSFLNRQVCMCHMFILFVPILYFLFFCFSLVDFLIHLLIFISTM